MLSDRISLIAVSFVGAVALGLVAICAFRPADIAALSGPLGVCIGALAGVIATHPRASQTAVGAADSVTVNPPADPVQEKQP